MSLVHRDGDYVFTAEVDYEDKENNCIVTFGYGSLYYIVSGNELSDANAQLSAAAAAAQEIDHWAGIEDVEDEAADDPSYYGRRN